MVNCFIISGPETITVVSKYIKSFSLKLIGTASSLNEGIDRILIDKPDIIYIDMECLESPLIEFDFLRERSFFIILSDTTNHAYDAFKFQAFDYLLKPISYIEFIKGIERFKRMRVHFSKKIPEHELLGDFFFIKVGENRSKEIRIKYADLLFIEAMQNYVMLNLEGGTSYMSYSTMKEMELHLPEYLFIRVHKSFIINYSKITSIEGSWINLNNYACKIQIGSTYKKMLSAKKEERMILGHKRRSDNF